MHRILLSTAAIFLLTSVGYAQTVYPIDRAEILAGSRFDLKVEFPGLVKPSEVTVTLNGADHAASARQICRNSSRRRTARSSRR